MSERKYTDVNGRSRWTGWPPERGVVRDLPADLYQEHRHLDTGRGLDIGLVRRIENEARAEMAEVEGQRMMDAVARNAERMREFEDRETPHRVEDTPKYSGRYCFRCTKPMRSGWDEEVCPECLDKSDTVVHCLDCARTLPDGSEGEVCDSCAEFSEQAKENRLKALAHRWESGLSLTWTGCKHTEAEARALLGLGENRTEFDPVGAAWRDLHAAMHNQEYVRGQDHQEGDELVPLFDAAYEHYDHGLHPLDGQWPSVE